MANPEITQMTRELAAASSPAHSWGHDMAQQLKFASNVKAMVTDTDPEIPLEPYLSDILSAANTQIALLSNQLRERLIQRFGDQAFNVYSAIYVEDQSPKKQQEALEKFDQLWDVFHEKDRAALMEESLVPYYWGILKPYRAEEPQS